MLVLADPARLAVLGHLGLTMASGVSLRMVLGSTGWGLLDYLA